MKKSRTGGLSWQQIGLIALCSVLALVLLALIFATAYANHFLSQINYIQDGTTLPSEVIESMEQEWTETMPSDYTGPVVDATDVTQPPYVGPTTLIQHPDILNFLLVGQDRRPGELRQRSDTMIVVTVNKRTGDIMLTSFLRDLYVDIPGYKPYKLNAAYAVGGFPMLCEALLTNFGVTIDGCVEVDFDGFMGLVDLVGGVDIDLTAKEVEHLNEIYFWTLTPGVNHLTGEQALAYSRIRALDNDFVRTERQRNVMVSIINSAKNMSLGDMQNLLTAALPMIATTMTPREITNYMIELLPVIANANIQTQRVPVWGSYTNVYIPGPAECLVPDLPKIRQQLIDTLLP